MKVIQTRESTKILTNAEVLAHLREVNAHGLTNPQYADTQKAKLRRLHAIVNEVHDHFQRIGLAASPLPTQAPAPSSDSQQPPDRGPHNTKTPPEAAHLLQVKAILDALPRSMRLTKLEKAMICNLRPRSVEELDCIIDESEERLGEEGMQGLQERLDACFAEYGWGDEKGGGLPVVKSEGG